MHWLWVLIVGAVIGAIAGAIANRGAAMGWISNIIAGLVNDYKDKYTLIKGVMQGTHTIKAVEQIHNISCACYLFHKCFNNKIGM